MTSGNQEQVVTPENILDTPPKVKSTKSHTTGNGGWIAAVIAALVMGLLGGIVAGMQIGKSSFSTSPGNQSQQDGMGGGMQGRGAMGTVTAVTSDSITIKSDRSDSDTTTTYAITSDTKVTDGNETAAVSDIAVGDAVMVQTGSSSSSSNGSGAKTAVRIEINPTMSGERGGAGGPDGTASSGSATTQQNVQTN